MFVYVCQSVGEVVYQFVMFLVGEVVVLYFGLFEGVGVFDGGVYEVVFYVGGVFGGVVRCFFGIVEKVWFVVYMLVLVFKGIYLVGYLFVVLVGGDVFFGCVDWQLQVVGVDVVVLGVGVVEGVVLEYFVVVEVQVVYQYVGFEGGLFGFGKYVFGVVVQCYLVDVLLGELFVGLDFGVVEGVKVEFGVFVVFYDLYEQVLLGKVVVFDGVVQVLGCVVEVGCLYFVGLYLCQVVYVLYGFLVVFDQYVFILVVDLFVGVYVVVLYEVVVCWNVLG